MAGLENIESKLDFKCNEQDIENHRKQTNWERPQTRLVTRILDEWKYLDSFHSTYAQHRMQYPDATCWARTRIDYIFFSPAFEGHIHSYKHINSTISDHKPIMVTFSIPSLK